MGLVVGLRLRGNDRLDRPEITRIGMHKRRPARKLFDSRQELPRSTLHPPDRKHLCQVPGIGVGIADLRADGMTRCRSFLGSCEVARPHEQHGFDRRNHVLREQHVELLGAQPKIGKRPFGFDVTDEEEIDGPPQQAHDGQPAVIGLRGGSHELIRGTQALTRVPRREHCVVQQRQTLTEHEWFAGQRAPRR